VTGTGQDLAAAACWAQAVRRHGPRRFLCVGGGDLSYAAFDRWARVIAGRLAARGVAPGHPVALVLGSTPAHLALLAGLSWLGAVAVPLDPGRPEPELRDLIRRCGAPAVLAEPDRELADATVLDATVLAAPPGPDERAVAAEPDVKPDDPWAILYTSGSTSRPRGVVIPQRAFGVTGQALANAHGYAGDDTVLCVQPLHHASATLMSWAPAAAAGASLALVERFSVSGFWPLVRQAGATVAIVVPTVAELLLTAPPDSGDRDHPLRLLVTHYEVPAFSGRFGTEVRTLWGMTETSGLGLTTRAGEPTAGGLVGRPYPPSAQVRLIGAQGREVPCGEVGEVLFAHPAVMTGYHGEPPPAGGWIPSGDLMRQLPDGSLAYLGRAKAVIKRGGENISAHEVERVLAGHPGVHEVVVVAVPDPVFVEEACAVVVWAGSPDPAGLRAYCAARLAGFQVPRYVAAWPAALPKLSNHKIDRRAVQASLNLSAADDRGPRAAVTKEDRDV
jgi:crotonobetaine/carnitine-CoA ligase